MENKAHALAAGLFVLVASALLLGLAAWLTRDGGPRDSYEISTRDAITGLQAQAPVRLRGVDVGQVTAIGFDPREPGNVLVRLAIDRQAPVTQATYASLAFQGVTGLAFVQLDDERPGAPRLRPAAGQAPRIPLRPGLVGRLTNQGEDLLLHVDQAVERLNRLLDEGNQQRVLAAVDEIGAAARGMSRLSSQLGAIAQAQFPAGQADLPGLLQRADAAIASLDQTSREVRASLTDAAGRLQADTLPRVNRVADEASRAARQLGQVAADLQARPQSLLLGPGRAPPGPGEPGFSAPAAGEAP